MCPYLILGLLSSVRIYPELSFLFNTKTRLCIEKELLILIKMMHINQAKDLTAYVMALPIM